MSETSDENDPPESRHDNRRTETQKAFQKIAEAEREDRLAKQMQLRRMRVIRN